MFLFIFFDSFNWRPCEFVPTSAIACVHFVGVWQHDCNACMQPAVELHVAYNLQRWRFILTYHIAPSLHTYSVFAHA